MTSTVAELLDPGHYVFLCGIQHMMGSEFLCKFFPLWRYLRQDDLVCAPSFESLDCRKTYGTAAKNEHRVTFLKVAQFHSMPRNSQRLHQS